MHFYRLSDQYPDTIPDYFNMDLNMRFFVLDKEDGMNEMVAAEMHVDYSEDFSAWFNVRDYPHW